MFNSTYRELTWPALILGFFQGLILNIAFVYAALKLGFSIPGSTVAAILGYTVLKGIMKKGTAVENNINQTIASGINTAGTGITFTLPALFLIDAGMKANGEPGLDFSLWPFILGGIAGSLLGTILIIPLRKQMIDLDRLRFPSGVAVTTIIRAGSSGNEKTILLLKGLLISAAFKIIMVNHWLDIPGVIEHEEWNFTFGLLPGYIATMLYLSLMNIGVGMLAGRSGLPLLIGAILAWWIISPASVYMGWVPVEAGKEASYIYGDMIRPLGIGTFIGGAIMGLILSFPAIKSALTSLAMAAKTARSGRYHVGSDEMPFKILIIGIIAAVTIFFTGAFIVESVTLTEAIIGSILGTLWLGIAGLIVAQATGMTDISPMSGMALITVTIMMFIFNKNIAAAMVIGVAVCVAIGQAADMMQDLKTGFMIGGRPYKQQIVQFATTWVGAILAIGVILVLWKTGPGGQGGFGPGTPLSAPQAAVLSGIIESIKSGTVPIDKYIMGGAIGGILGLAPIAGLGVLVGLAMYLPFSINFGYGMGCIITMLLQRKYGSSFIENKIVPFAAGLIVGEALTGVGHAFLQILKSS